MLLGRIPLIRKTPGHIVIVGSPVEAQAIDGNNVTLTLPTGMQRGDVVYVFFGISAALGGGTSSSGWTQLGATTDSTSSHTRAQAFRKVMGAVPDTEIVLTASANASNSAAAVGFALRGVDNEHPEDATTVITIGTSTTPDSASITTVTDKSWVLSFFSSGRVLDSAVTAPSGYSNQVDIAADDNNDVTVGGATKETTTAGAEDPPSWTGVLNANWVAASVAVRPA